MNVLLQGVRPAQDQARHLVVHGLDWASYEKLLEALAEVHVRTTYDRGTLEIMSPLPIHERYRACFDRLLFALAEELGLPCVSLSSATFRRRDQLRGLEPDQCYYLASSGRVRNWRELSLPADPPPDLAFEVEITSNCLDRLGVYAGLGVPEVWRFDGDALECLRLGQDGQYAPQPQSLAFPHLPLGELPSFLNQCADCHDEVAFVRGFRLWVRQHVLPLYQAAAQPPPGAAG